MAANDTGIQSFFQALLAARPQFLSQQQGLLESLGGPLRQALFSASPELAMTSNYLQSQFSNPLPPDLAQDYAERIRTAQAARGFGGGGTGPAGEEARFLLGAADQRRMQLLPQLQQFGANVLGMTGLQGPPNLDFASIASALLGQNRLNAETAAGQSQSRFAQQMYQDMLRGRGTFGAGGNRVGGGGSSSVYGGSGGGGTPDWFQTQSAPYQNQGYGGGFYGGQSAAGGAFGGSYGFGPGGGLATGPAAGVSRPDVPDYSSTYEPQAVQAAVEAGANWGGTGKSYRELHPWNFS